MIEPTGKPDLAALAKQLRWQTPLRPRDLCRMFCSTGCTRINPDPIPLRDLLIGYPQKL